MLFPESQELHVQETLHAQTHILIKHSESQPPAYPTRNSESRELSCEGSRQKLQARGPSGCIERFGVLHAAHGLQEQTQALEGLLGFRMFRPEVRVRAAHVQALAKERLGVLQAAHVLQQLAEAAPRRAPPFRYPSRLSSRESFNKRFARDSPVIGF